MLLDRVVPPERRAPAESQALPLAGLAVAAPGVGAAGPEAALQADGWHGAVGPRVRLVADAGPGHADAVAVAVAGALRHCAPRAREALRAPGIAAVGPEEVLAAGAPAVEAEPAPRARVGAPRGLHLGRLAPAGGQRVAAVADALGGRAGGEEGAGAVARAAVIAALRLATRRALPAVLAHAEAAPARAVLAAVGGADLVGA